MARSDILKNEITRIHKKIADLQKDESKYQEAADKAKTEARKKRDTAHKTNSASTRRMAFSTAERKDREATALSKKVAGVATKIAELERSRNTKQKSLAAAEQSERKALRRSEDQRRREEKNHARQMTALTRTTVRYVQEQPPTPEPLRVLYLTANPHAMETTVEHADGSVETNGMWLRVDQEVRQVKQELRASKERDRITVEHLPAATGKDLLDGLNDHRPHVVHFSGHASALGVLLESNTGSQEGEGFAFDLLARVLGATDEPPRMVVLNACESLEGADDLLQTVPTIIGMSESITDLAAITFAAQFYAAIASAQSVATAVEQAKTAMKMASLKNSDLPEIRARKNVDPTSLVLVQPS